jgi:hypothetical protein
MAGEIWLERSCGTTVNAAMVRASRIAPGMTKNRT